MTRIGRQARLDEACREAHRVGGVVLVLGGRYLVLDRAELDFQIADNLEQVLARISAPGGEA